MKIFITGFVLLSLLSFSAMAQEDVPGCKDSPMFNRMPNMVITDCSSNFDEMEITIGTEKKETKEGTKTTIRYDYTLEEATAPSFFSNCKKF